MKVDRLVFYVKMVVIPAAFFAAFGLVLTGAFVIALGKPMAKLGGLGLLLVGIAISAVALWFSLGRPPEWFAPGENTDYDPRR